MGFKDHIATLAAGAPDIPHWFKPGMETPCPQPLFRTSDGKEVVLRNDFWYLVETREGEEITTLLDIPDDEVEVTNRQDITDWKTKYERERLFQWPVFYATQVMQRIDRIR